MVILDITIMYRYVYAYNNTANNASDNAASRVTLPPASDNNASVACVDVQVLESLPPVPPPVPPVTSYTDQPLRLPGKLLKRIAKSYRELCSRKLAGILQVVVTP